MGKSIKLDNDTYWDASGISVDETGYTLKSFLGYVPHIQTVWATATGWQFKVVQDVSQMSGRLTFIVICGHQSGGGRGRIAVCSPNNNGSKITSIAVDWYQPYSVSGSFNTSFDATTEIFTITANNSPWSTCMVIYDHRFMTITNVY